MKAVTCPNCDSKNISYAVNTTVFFNLYNGHVQVDMEYLTGQLEEDTNPHHVYCTCNDCSWEFSLADGGDIV